MELVFNILVPFLSTPSLYCQNMFLLVQRLKQDLNCLKPTQFRIIFMFQFEMFLHNFLNEISIHELLKENSFQQQSWGKQARRKMFLNEKFILSAINFEARKCDSGSVVYVVLLLPKIIALDKLKIGSHWKDSSETRKRCRAKAGGGEGKARKRGRRVIGKELGQKKHKHGKLLFWRWLFN